MTYVHNCWYMAGWADEVPATGTLVRTLLDQPVLLFRDGDGTAKAVHDRCPHRFAPLSSGKIEDGVITCGYHGLSFDGSGACVANPHGPISRALSVRSYPMLEAYKALWIWMGDAELADASKLRDFSYFDTVPETAYSKGYIRGEGHFQLYVDNILDLSHVDFLHPLFGGGAITRTRAKITELDKGVIAVRWHSPDDVPTPLFQRFLPEGTARVESWSEVRWSAPGVMTLEAGAVPVGAPTEDAGRLFNSHMLTPETATSTHYFFASTRTFALDDEELNESIRRIRLEVFSTEDEPMIAAQQGRIGDKDFWSLNPALLRIDEGAVKVRRRMDALMADEA